jgi:hypothetical protein
VIKAAKHFVIQSGDYHDSLGLLPQRIDVLLAELSSSYG